MPENLENIAREIVDAFNANDWASVKEAMAPDAVYNELGTQRTIRGPDQIAEAWQGWKQAFPDVRGTVKSMVASGNSVAVEVQYDGIHTGPLMTPNGVIPPTGKPQSTRCAWVIDFEGDKVKESRMYFDMMTMMQQLGIMPS
jgi:steroid delta-isomerase-like uncharacterized protein